MDAQVIIDLINQYGFPIVAAVGMGYFVYFIYSFVTSKLTPLISETSTVLIALIDRVRMLDNDLIRLQQKVSVTLQIKEHKQQAAQEQMENEHKSKTGTSKNI
jgi:hypothetical protein